MKTRTENWRGYSIRFVEIDNAWWAVLKDICDALNLSTWKVAQRLEPNMLEKVSIEADLPSSPVTSKNGVRKSQTMLIVNEIGIYEALFASRRLEDSKHESSAYGPEAYCNVFVKTSVSNNTRSCA